MVFSVTNRLLVFGVMFRRSLFVLFRLTIVLSVLWLLITPLVSSKHVLLSFFLLVILFSVLLRLTDSDYPFGIFKLFSFDSVLKNSITYLFVKSVQFKATQNCSRILCTW